MSTTAGTPRGLSAVELAAAIAELQPRCGAVVVDVVAVAAVAASKADPDLLLVLQDAGGDGKKHFLHLAAGGPRARITLTARRFGRELAARSPQIDLLHRELVSATLTTIAATPGERSAEFGFSTSNGPRRLVVELFGARGLWALLDSGGKALALSRRVETAVRRLGLGDLYAAPPAGSKPRDEHSRFAEPVLPAIDTLFTALDQASTQAEEHALLQRAAGRAMQKANAKAEGLARQLVESDRTDELRARADLMLAYAHTARRGANHMIVPDIDSGEPVRIELDPSLPVAVQARALYDKARRLRDGREMTLARLAEAEAAVAALREVVAAIETVDATDTAAVERLAPYRRELQRLHALPAAQQPKAPTKPTKHAGATRPGENFRRFVSAEGYPILVGRNNTQNDHLTMHIAKGNDLWLHVGGGRPGSHVVVRLPKEKTASLETLLDAATLAVHFSKARGERRIDVIYTHKKHVRKPKGLPPGAVVPAQTKTITVDLDEGRLRRVLDSGGGEDA